MSITKINVASSTNLTEVEKILLIEKMESFASYKREKTAIDAQENNAKATRAEIVSLLGRVVPNLGSAFELQIEGDKTSHIVSSKQSKTTYLDKDEMEEKIKELTANLDELKMRLVLVQNGAQIVKTEPKITFNIKTLEVTSK